MRRRAQLLGTSLHEGLFWLLEGSGHLGIQRKRAMLLSSRELAVSFVATGTLCQFSLAGCAFGMCSAQNNLSLRLNDQRNDLIQVLHSRRADSQFLAFLPLMSV